jgi:hypothetical protein
VPVVVRVRKHKSYTPTLASDKTVKSTTRARARAPVQHAEPQPRQVGEDGRERAQDELDARGGERRDGREHRP